MRAVRRGWKGMVEWLLAGLLLAGCGSAVPAPTIVPGASPGLLRPTKTIPSMTASVVSPLPTGTATPVPALVPPTAEGKDIVTPAVGGVALGEGWTHYLGTYLVNDVAFGPDKVAWATDGGVLVWDWDDEMPRRYTAVGDGIGSDYVTEVAVAPDGSVWAATLGGVSHLVDGAWATYTQADGLADDAPQAIEVTADGVVWVGTTQGVSRYADGAWTSFLPGTRAWEIDVGPDGSVWFAGDAAGLIRYQPGSDTWTTYLPEGELPPGVKTVGVDSEGDPWVYQGYDRVYRVDINDESGTATWEPVYDASGEWVCGIDFDAAGAPWLATCHGFHTYGAGLVTRDGLDGEWRHVNEAQWLASSNMLAVKAVPEAVAEELGWEMVAATDRGLRVRGEDKSWSSLLGWGPVSNRITAVTATSRPAEGSQSIVWFGFGDDTQPFPGGGISLFDPATPDASGGGTWSHLLEERNVQELAVAPDGGLWASAGCEVWHLDPANTRQAADPDQPPTLYGYVLCDLLQGNVLDFALEPGGAAWVATGLDLGRFERMDWQALDRMVHSVAVAPDGALWAAGWEGTQGSDYVARYDGQEWTTVLDRSLSSLVVTDDGNVWGLAGEQGVARFDGSEWTWYDDVQGLSLATASVLAVDPAADGRGAAVWVAGAGALFRFEEDAWTVYDLPAAVASVTIEDMAIEENGTIWLATSRGALRFEPDEQ